MNEYLFRLFTFIILATGLGISGYFRRKADRDTGEKIPRHADGVVMMTIIRLGGLVLWFSPILYLVNPGWMLWSKIGLPIWVRWLGVGFGFLCTIGIYWLFKSLGNGVTPTSATRMEHKLVASGPYRWVRHPLYVIGSSMFVAFGMIADNWFIGLLGVFVFILMAIRTPQEEARLIEKFGNEYLEYMQRTGRFFPGKIKN